MQTALILVFILVQLFRLPPRSYAEPIWGSKPLLGYFALTTSIIGPMREQVALNPIQYRMIRRVAEAEVEQLRALELESREIVLDETLTLEQKRQSIIAMGYNQRVMEIVQASQERLWAGLDPRTYDRLVRWIESRWQLERKLHGSPVQGASPRSFEVFATRYDSNGAYYVALPDKCVKFANGGSHICDEYGYQVGKAYEVIVRYKSSTGARVGESGPWNVDDTYWATSGDPTPRRKFADLPLGMPEAQAAYFNGYNGGVDQFGRKVTAPYGIDLARQVSIDIGLKPGNNDWVTVSYMWTGNWGAASSSDGSSVPGATAIVIQPLQTAVPNPDGSVVHEVQYGETLWTIADAYQITLNELLVLNGLSAEAVILPGDQLIVRPSSEPAAASPTIKPSQKVTKPIGTATRRPKRTATALANLEETAVPNTVEPTSVSGSLSEGSSFSPGLVLGLIGILIAVGIGMMLIGALLGRHET